MRASIFVFGPCPDSARIQPKSAAHHAPFVARHVLEDLPERRRVSWTCPPARAMHLTLLSRVLAPLRRCGEPSAFPFTRSGPPFLFFLACYCCLRARPSPPWPVMPSPWPPSFRRLQPPSTQIDRTTTALTARRNPRTPRLKPLVTGAPSPWCGSA